MIGKWLCTVSVLRSFGFVRMLIVCIAIVGPVTSAFAQDQCVASHYSHYGSFGETVTGRGTANRGPLISGTAQGALDAAVAWVPLVDGDIVFASRCGADMTWRLGEVIWRDSTRTSYAILTDRDAPYCAEVFKNARIGEVMCYHSQNLVLQLVAPLETRPSGTGGSSIAAMTAKVTFANQPKPGVVLSFSVEVTANSGGHEHNDANRPKGTLNRIQGTTDANGEVKLTFQAPEFAGIHTIKANCATCSNTVVAKEVQVKVPDLLPISPNPPQNPDGSFVYALTSVDKTHQGNGRYHHQQYYLTQQSRQNLRDLISDFAAEGWGTVALNDASLYWGGRYDINANWAGSHAGHREGREIDISFNRAGNPISASKQSDFYDKFCKSKKVSFPFSVLHHYVLNPHFHVYLEKQTACWKSGS